MLRPLLAALVAIVSLIACTQSTLDLGTSATPTPTPSAPPPALVQQAVATSAVTMSLTATLPSAPSPGSLLVMIGSTPCAPIATVTGGGVASWTRATRSTTHANFEIWYGVVAAPPASNTTISTSCTGQAFFSVSEWSGMSVSGTLDAADSQAATGATTTATAPPISTTNAKDLVLFGVSGFAPVVYGAPTLGPWQALTSSTSGGLALSLSWSTTTATVAAFQPSVSTNASNWEAGIAAFKSAGP